MHYIRAPRIYGDRVNKETAASIVCNLDLFAANGGATGTET